MDDEERTTLKLLTTAEIPIVEEDEDLEQRDTEPMIELPTMH